MISALADGLNVGVGPDPDNAIAPNEHTGSRGDAKVARIEQAGVADNEVATRLMCERVSDALRPGGVRFFLGRQQLRDADSSPADTTENQLDIDAA